MLSPDLQEEYTLVQTDRTPRARGRALPSISKQSDEEEVLIDTTATLTLISRKTKRLQKQQLKKQKQSSQQVSNFLELPSEIVIEILSWLQPSDIFRLLRLNRATREYIHVNENHVARNIIYRRYHVLSRCFPLPISATQLDEATQAVLLNPRRQEMLGIHKKPYQHIRPLDVTKTCTCTWCIFCWNNLCLILDLAHFQSNLNDRIPIPVIPRGTNQTWNLELTEHSAAKVEAAMQRPLIYAAILGKHLASIIGTLTRVHQYPRQVKSGSGKWVDSKETVRVPLYRERPYGLTDAEAKMGTDTFLERKGKPSYELPFQRDNYYALEAYVPNRKWLRDEERWLYYGTTRAQHENDVALAMRWFKPKVETVEMQSEGLEERK